MTDQISTSVEGDVTVVTVRGSLAFDLARNLIDEIEAALAKGNKKIVVDLSSVTYINSMGVASLVTVFTKVSNNGGRVILSGLTRKTSDLLQTTKLNTIFDVVDSVANATTLLAT